MITLFHTSSGKLTCDLSKPLDLTLPVGRAHSPNAFHLAAPKYQAVIAEDFVGNVEKGGSCNCEDICFNAHGDGTHTECAGHIARHFISINDVLKQSFFYGELITLSPEENQITAKILKNSLLPHHEMEALIIRTLPNDDSKKTRNYSGANPPFFTKDAILFLNTLAVKHLLTDLPSIDKEDDTELTAHHAFFIPEGKWLMDKTITEMIYVPAEIKDGRYMVEIQIAPFESDASPSRVRLYKTDGKE
jgi:kynurenine formamidase